MARTLRAMYASNDNMASGRREYLHPNQSNFWGFYCNTAKLALGPHPPTPSPNTGRGGDITTLYPFVYSPLSQYWERGVGGVRAGREVRVLRYCLLLYFFKY